MDTASSSTMRRSRSLGGYGGRGRGALGPKPALLETTSTIIRTLSPPRGLFLMPPQKLQLKSSSSTVAHGHQETPLALEEQASQCLYPPAIAFQQRNASNASTAAPPPEASPVETAMDTAMDSPLEQQQFYLQQIQQTNAELSVEVGGGEVGPRGRLGQRVQLFPPPTLLSTTTSGGFRSGGSSVNLSRVNSWVPYQHQQHQHASMSSAQQQHHQNQMQLQQYENQLRGQKQVSHTKKVDSQLPPPCMGSPTRSLDLALKLLK
ncbi:unnamed protein product, partial [Amoebophrya sp. A25]|eukprot:GSA25T00019543001.1